MNRHINCARGVRGMLDLGNTHPSEAFRVGRQVKFTGWTQCGQDLTHEKAAQHSLQKSKKIAQKWWGSEHRPRETPGAEDLQRQGKLGQWREMEGHPSLEKGFSSARTNQAALGKETVIHSTESSHKRKERQQNPRTESLLGQS